MFSLIQQQVWEVPEDDSGGNLPQQNTTAKKAWSRQNLKLCEDDSAQESEGVGEEVTEEQDEDDEGFPGFFLPTIWCGITKPRRIRRIRTMLWARICSNEHRSRRTKSRVCVGGGYKKGGP